MICIVGLGNPGEKYQHNRHNVGFMFIDYLLDTLRVTGHENRIFSFDKYTNSLLVKFVINNEEYLLAKPQTFMNKSGEAVRKITNHYSLTTNHLIVVHDDLDIPLGKFKIQKSGPQLHNGLESIEQYLKTKDFLRIRIGVDARSPEYRIDGETYVLQDFSHEELTVITQIFPKIITRLEQQNLLI